MTETLRVNFTATGRIDRDSTKMLTEESSWISRRVVMDDKERVKDLFERGYHIVEIRCALHCPDFLDGRLSEMACTELRIFNGNPICAALLSSEIYREALGFPDWETVKRRNRELRPEERALTRIYPKVSRNTGAIVGETTSIEELRRFKAFDRWSNTGEDTGEEVITKCKGLGNRDGPETCKGRQHGWIVYGKGLELRE